MMSRLQLEYYQHRTRTETKKGMTTHISVSHQPKITYVNCASRVYKKMQCNLRLLTHVGFFSKTESDTFRGVLIYGKEQESRKKCFITVQKN